MGPEKVAVADYFPFQQGDVPRQQYPFTEMGGGRNIGVPLPPAIESIEPQRPEVQRQLPDVGIGNKCDRCLCETESKTRPVTMCA